MQTLPYERVIDILNLLKVGEVINFCQTNRCYHRICEDWTFWSNKARQDLKISRDLFHSDNFNPIGRYLLIRNLVSDPILSLNNEIKDDNTDTVSILLDYLKSHPKIHDIMNNALCLAVTGDCTKVLVPLLDLLESHPNVNDIINDAFFLAVNENHPKSLKILLNDNHIQSLNIQYGLINASRRGHVNIVDILLEDSRIYPGIFNNMPIKEAVRRGHADVLARLLKHPRVDPNYYDNLATSIQKNNMHIFDLLIADSRVNPAILGNYPLKVAISNKRIHFINKLLQDHRVRTLFVDQCVVNPKLCAMILTYTGS